MERFAFDRLRNINGLVQEALQYGRHDIFNQFNKYTQLEVPEISPLEQGSIELE